MAAHVPVLLGFNLVPRPSLRTGQDNKLELAWVLPQHQEWGGCAGPRAVVETGLAGFDPTPNRGKFKLQGRGAQSPGFVALFALSCDVLPCGSGCLQLKMPLPQP